MTEPFEEVHRIVLQPFTFRKDLAEKIVWNSNEKEAGQQSRIMLIPITLSEIKENCRNYAEIYAKRSRKHCFQAFFH